MTLSTCTYGDLSYLLSDLTTTLDLIEDGGDTEVAVVVDGREYHALALFAHHLARRKVGNEKYTLAD